MYQRVAYEGLSFRRRREVHLAIGCELERDRADPAVLSLHFARAEDHPRAYEWSVAAARGAQRAYANAEATELYRRALASAARVPAVGAEQRAELGEALGDVLELSANYDAAAIAYTDARRAAAGGDDARSPRTVARLLRKLGVLREHVGAYTDALNWYSRAMTKLSANGGGDTTAAERAELELAYAGVRFRQGKHDDARRVLLAIDHITDTGDPSVLGHAYYLLTAIDVARGDTAPPSGPMALTLLEQQGDLVPLAKLYNNLGVAAYFAGRWDDALVAYERSHDLGRRTGDAILEATLANNIGEILSDRGELDAAVEQFEAALATFHSATYPLGIALASGNLGRAYLRRGDVDGAVPLLREAHQRFETDGASTNASEMLVRLAECANAAGDPDGALELLAQAEQRLRAAPDPFVEVGVRRARAEALARADRLPEAVVDAEAAVELARRIRATYEEARSLSVRAAARRALAAAGDADAVAAAALFAALGVRRASPRASERGDSVRTGDGSSPAALPERATMAG
jgi:tetratricopeptide (TPR) repeat protein